MKHVRIALLHLAPVAGDLRGNCAAVARAMEIAAARGADWTITPELCLSGYQFRGRLGVDWIAPAPDAWTQVLSRQAARLHVALVLGHAERDAAGRVYNSALVIDRRGEIIGRHRKVNVHSDGWSTPGDGVAPVDLDGIRVGVMICADAYTPKVATALAGQGAQMLVSPAAWGPGLHGPNGEWEQRTRDTRLPLIVCNRTGADETLDFTGANSLVIAHGQRLLAYAGPAPAVLIVDWDAEAMTLVSSEMLKDMLTPN